MLTTARLKLNDLPKERSPAGGGAKCGPQTLQAGQEEHEVERRVFVVMRGDQDRAEDRQRGDARYDCAG
jgi:hypothetical protein